MHVKFLMKGVAAYAALLNQVLKRTVLGWGKHALAAVYHRHLSLGHDAAEIECRKRPVCQGGSCSRCSSLWSEFGSDNRYRAG